MSDPTVKVIEQATKTYIDTVIEHADSIQVFVTVTENGKSRTYTNGEGNWYARYAQIREWLIREDERIRQDLRDSLENDPES